MHLDTEAISKTAGLVLVSAFFAVVLAAFYWASPGLLFPNSDFERGDLSGWKADGDAFKGQPTLGDNPYYRQIGTARAVGNFWIGTAESHHTALDRPGLVSNAFLIRHRRISFLLGAGDGTDKEGVALEVDGTQVLFEPGRAAALHGEGMRRVVWDVRRWVGRRARIVVVDQSTGIWGHINVDDFRYR